MNKTCVRSKDNMNSIGDMPMLDHIQLKLTKALRADALSSLWGCDPTTCYTQLLEELPLQQAASACPSRENVSQQELTAIGQRSIDGFRELSTSTQFPKTIERHCV
jgi:hypothetical protein